MYITEKINRYFYVFASLSLASICTNFIAFVSPFWIQSVPEAHSLFRRIGLWSVCFDGYMRPTQYQKAYFGCYYIYFIEYDLIRDWLNPAWLYAIQATYSAGILLHFLVTFVVLCQFNNAINRDDVVAVKFCLVGHFFICFSLVAVLVAFAVARYDSTWMPYPHLNVLSWSYAMGALSLALSFTAFVVGFLRFLYMDALRYTEASQRQSLLKSAEEGEHPNYPVYSSTNRPDFKQPDYYNDDYPGGDFQDEAEAGIPGHGDQIDSHISPSLDPRYPPPERGFDERQDAPKLSHAVAVRDFAPERRYR